MKKSEWLRCPVCGNKTRLQIREDTELKNFPLYCPKCKHEALIVVKDFLHSLCARIGLIKEKRQTIYFVKGVIVLWQQNQLICTQE